MQHSTMLAVIIVLFGLALQFKTAITSNEFRVGVIMVEKSVLPFKMEMVGPALDMAFEVAEKEYNIKFQKVVKLYPDYCNAVLTSGAIAELYYEHNVTALIGPGCSGDITVCGKLATHLGLPQVTGVGDLVLGKEDYPTLTRLSYSLEKQSAFVMALLDHFQWLHVAIIYDTHDILTAVQGSALTRALRDLANSYVIPFNTMESPDLDSFLEDVSKRARVILFLSSGEDLRNFMLLAKRRGMTNGEYAFITIELFRSEAWGDFSWRRGDAEDESAKKAYESLFVISLTEPSGPRWDNFSAEVVQRAQRDYGFVYEEAVNYFVGAFYDGVIYLARSLNRTIEDNEDTSDGFHVAQKLWNSTFTGIMGKVHIDDIGDRLADYSLLDMADTDNGTFQIVAKYCGATRVLKMETDVPIHWPGTGQPPKDMPECGFEGDACVEEESVTVTIVAGTCVLLVVVTVIVGCILYRRLKFEAALSNMSWKVQWNDIIIVSNDVKTSSSRLGLSLVSLQRESSSGVARSTDNHIGTYRGVLVAIRKLNKDRVDLSRTIMLELKEMREVQHDNLARFVGACIEPKHVAILTEYCCRGSLQDILANGALTLDWVFKFSLIKDIVEGLTYLHGCPIQVHGKLKSSNCVVDGKFVLKLTAFGLRSFREGDESLDENEYSNMRDKLWTAPELLKTTKAKPTKAGDIYSFGIILNEILTRAEPYDEHDLSPKEIISRLLTEETPPFRPTVDAGKAMPEICHLTERCWAQSPADRPTSDDVRKALRQISSKSNISGHIWDNIMRRMQQYANNLETLVEERTRAFLDEKKRSEELLLRVLPRSVANQLKQGNPVRPEAFECVTIYFSDIVGFTALSASCTPMQVVDVLNDLYSSFDAIVDSYDVYKVETVGDAYMVVSGLPLRNGNEHAREISRMSLSLLAAIRKIKIRHRPDEHLQLRIGIHSGPCAAGVVGQIMPRYCLFGDTVNTASRLESTGEALRIHISYTTKDLLDKVGKFHVLLRGETAMKGKGTMTTYWLINEIPKALNKPASASSVNYRII